jgi:hypothetical protein
MAHHSGIAQRDALRPVASSSSSERPGLNEAVSALAHKPAASGSWDPYEVWLTRVKQPRDQRLLDPNGSR